MARAGASPAPTPEAASFLLHGIGQLGCGVASSLGKTMNRLLATLWLDVRLQVRHRIYAISIPMALVLGLALRALFSAEQAASVLAVFYLLIVGASTYFFAAALVLLDKSDGVFAALRTSPLSPATYLGSKTVTLTGLLLVECGLIYLIAFGGTLERLWPLVLGLVLLAAMQTLLGLGQVAPHDAVTSFLVPGAAIMGTVLQLPVFWVFGAGPPWIWYLVPTQGPLLLILAAFEPIEPWQWLYALGVSTLATAWAGWWALRRFRRHIDWQGGA